MGIFSGIKLAGYAGAGIASPFNPGPSHLAPIVWAQLLDSAALPPTRDAAMQVPAVARARHLIAPTIGRCPLTVWRGPAQVPDPAWIHNAGAQTPPYQRMLWTIDDLIFHGWSLWALERGAAGQVLAAARVPIETWSFDDDGRVMVDSDDPDGTPHHVRDDEVALIAGPHEGILTFAAGTIEQASALAQTTSDRAKNPAAVVEIHYDGEKELTQEERRDVIKAWQEARQQPGGAVGFTGRNTKLITHDVSESALLIEGRNAAAVDIARHVGIPAAMLDATTEGASLTYETTESRNGQFIDYGLAAYLEAVQSRLSLDDVVPRGQSVRFDLAQLRDLAPAGAVTND